MLFIVFLAVCELTKGIKWNFLMNAEKWQITGNKYSVEIPTHETYGLSNGVNRYIIGHDTLINTDYFNKNDKNIWYFTSPFFTASLTNKSFLKFTLVWFSGSTSVENLNSEHLNKCVSLCEKRENWCITSACYQIGLNFGSQTVVPFVERWWSGNFREFSKKFFRKQTEYQLSILGDWTQRNETFGLDNVSIE